MRRTVRRRRATRRAARPGGRRSCRRRIRRTPSRTDRNVAATSERAAVKENEPMLSAAEDCAAKPSPQNQRRNQQQAPTPRSCRTLKTSFPSQNAFRKFHGAPVQSYARSICAARIFLSDVLRIGTARLSMPERFILQPRPHIVRVMRKRAIQPESRTPVCRLSENAGKPSVPHTSVCKYDAFTDFG